MDLHRRRRSHSRRVLAAGTGQPAADPNAYRSKVLALEPVAYWPLSDALGATVCTSAIATNQNGAYDTGCLLGEAGIGDGLTSLFADDGVQCGADCTAAALGAVFDPALGTLLIWLKSNSLEDWTDGKEKLLFTFAADTSNYICAKKVGANSTLNISRAGGGLSRAALVANPNTTDWICLVATWNYSISKVRLYINGTYADDNGTDLTAWTGAPGALAFAGFAGEPDSPPGTWKETWHGNLAHGALWARVLSDVEIASLAVVP